MIPGAVSLETRIAETCGHLNAMHGQLVGLVADAIRTEAWSGFRSPEHWLTIHAGISTASASRVVGLARRADGLPDTAAALARGELSIDQAALVARFVPDHNDTEVVGFARAATVAQLRSTLRKYPFDHPDPLPDREGREPDIDSTIIDTTTGPVDIGDNHRCAWFYDDDGNFRLHLTTNAFDGALIETAINSAYDRLCADGGTDVTNLAAFVEMANQALNAPDGAGPADRTRVHVHLDTAGCFVHQGPTIPRSLRDQILCDTILRPVWESDGLPVNVGRDQRVVPERTRRVIEHRDQSCRYPGCTRRRHLDVHHVIHWLYDGVTDTWNLVLLCPHHHRAHHRGEFGLTGNADIADHLDHPDGLIFTRPDGTRIRACERPIVPTGPAPAPISKFIHPTGERFEPTLLAFRNHNGSYDLANTIRHRRRRAAAEQPAIPPSDDAVRIEITTHPAGRRTPRPDTPSGDDGDSA